MAKYFASSTAKQRIAVAVSGGVDSSVAAFLLHRFNQSKSPGADIIGLYMNNWNINEEQQKIKTNAGCARYEKDVQDARAVCKTIGLKMHEVSFESEYWTDVFQPFVEGIGEGRMPNPDVGCNSYIKFGAMRDYAMKNLACDYISTGHYARLLHRDLSHDEVYSTSPDMSYLEEHVAGTPEENWIFSWGKKFNSPFLLSGADIGKDQSYFLCGVRGDCFRNVIFPLGDLLKKKTSRQNNGVEEVRKEKNDDDMNLKGLHLHGTGNSDISVREIAALACLSTASKRESMGICFIGKRKFSEFVSDFLPQDCRPGNFIDIDTGEIVGQHKGCNLYTIGEGAKISGAKRKFFVCKKAADGNTLFVCNNTHHPALYSDELNILVSNFNWIGGELPQPLIEGQKILAYCRIRHLQPLVPCTISRNLKNTMYLIKFDRPVRGITLGQTAALYVGGGLVCLGGGPIFNHGPTVYELGDELPISLHPAGINDLSVL